MPFIRQTRDKRGMEHVYVMHTYRSPGGDGVRTRVLYVFRSPANLRIGRTPLDPEVREALEHTHPDLTFDWQGLTRDAAVVRPEPAGAGKFARPRSERPSGGRVGQADSRAARATSPDERGRVRGRYRELEERITRRARTPEDRDRLLERLRRLNPDDWPDGAPAATLAADAGREFDAIAAELPSRRRGRHSGRGRGRQEGADAASGIIAGEQSHADNAVDEGSEPARGVESGSDGGDGGSDGGGLGPADPSRPAASDLPGDD